MPQQTGALFGTNFTDVNVNVEGSNREEQRAKEIGASKIEDFLPVVTGAMSLATKMSQAERLAESNSARADWLLIATSEGWLRASETERAEVLEEQYVSLKDRSEGYANAFRGFTYSSYGRAYEGRDEETEVSVANSIYPGYVSWKEEESGILDSNGNPLSNEAAGLTAEDYITKVTKNTSLSPANMRDALYTSVMQDNNLKVESARSRKELSDVRLELEETEKDFNNDRFRLSKNKKFSSLVQEEDRNRQAIIVAKEQEFLYENRKNIAASIDNGYSTPPEKLEEDFAYAYTNPIEREKKQQEYAKKHTETIEANNWNMQHPLGENPAIYPNETAKKIRQRAVTDALPELLVEGNITEFIRVADNEVGLTKETGDMLLSAINKSKDPAELDVILNTIATISQHPNGSPVLRQMFTDDEFVRLTTINYFRKFKPEYTAQEARDFVAKTASNTARVELPMSDKKKMQEYAVKLGKQGQAFLGVMKVLTDTDPNIAISQMKEVASFFAGQVGKTPTGVKADFSMGTFPETLDEDALSEHIDAALPGATSYSFIGKNLVVGYDDIGGQVKMINIAPLIERTNRVYEGIKMSENRGDIDIGIYRTVKNVLGNAGRSILDNLGPIATGIPRVGGELVSNIGGALGENITRNLKKDKEFIKRSIENSPEFVRDAVGFMKMYLDIEIDNPKEASKSLDDILEDAVIANISQESRQLDTGNIDVHNNTMSPYTKTAVAYSVENNKAKKKVLDGIVGAIKAKRVERKDKEIEDFLGVSIKEDIKNIFTKAIDGYDPEGIAAIESNGRYDAKNPKSTAFGKYQHIIATTRAVAKRLGISVEEARTSKGQERVQRALENEYTVHIKGLGLKVNQQNMLSIHQLGYPTFKKAVKGLLTAGDFAVLKENVPIQYNRFR